jgi:hypothetical protein
MAFGGLWGMCCCGNGGVPCGTCSLPEEDLMLTISGTNEGTGDPASFALPLVYYPGSGWFTDCLTTAPFDHPCGNGSPLGKFGLACGPSPDLSWYQYCGNGIGEGTCPASPEVGDFVYRETTGPACDSSTACGGGCSGYAYKILSYECSPLNIVYQICVCSVFCSFSDGTTNWSFNRATITL